VEFAVFGEDHILFVNSERSSLIFVYDISDPSAPVFLQALPAGLEPEGGKAIPERNLYVVPVKLTIVVVKSALVLLFMNALIWMQSTLHLYQKKVRMETRFPLVR